MRLFHRVRPIGHSLLGQNELVLRGEPQAIDVFAVANGDLARADEEFAAVEPIIIIDT